MSEDTATATAPSEKVEKLLDEIGNLSLFEAAELLAAKAGDTYVAVERLLLALAAATGTAAADVLKNAGVTPQ
ncbi:MAG: Clp protease N-terminal domain-containing protein, partial [Planctomycetota bacterium]|nr:Clp protease N-terminal domain-containing protein [Planctomycetota bacterium]